MSTFGLCIISQLLSLRIIMYANANNESQKIASCQLSAANIARFAVGKEKCNEKEKPPGAERH
jgi:hypothetical protein